MGGAPLKKNIAISIYEGGYLRNTLRGGVIFYFYRQNQLVPGFGLKIEYVIDETEL